ncbi:MAG: ABC transporter ATP-binding protein [Candidatus Korarchaeota archaeon]|nr:ABC transporter ATP-binding protein [Candidatus Korarchaeota archaeon]
MLLVVEDLVKHYVSGGFLSKKEVVRAVEGVSFTLDRGETLGLVGESGSGKTTVGKTVLRLVEPTSGRILFEDRDITSIRDMRPLRKEMQIVYQDPMSSMNPRMRIADIVGRPLQIHGLVSSRRERDDRVRELLERVGLSREHLYRYPHEFSGGQRQRIAIARALASEPKFVVLDEPTSALDVSVQAQILRLLKSLQEERGLAYLFISHDLAVVRNISHRVAVMYAGKLVELASVEEIFGEPLHPYTNGLLASVLEPSPEASAPEEVLPGEPPDPRKPPRGCRFHPRCPIADERCREEEPELREIRPGHWVACHKV